MSLGWILVYVIAGVLDIYMTYHYLLVQFPKHKKTKWILCIALHVMTLLTIIYFYFYFNGSTEARPLRLMAYLAAFHLGFLCYSTIMFLIYDIFRFIGLFITYPQKLRRITKSFLYNGFTIFVAAILLVGGGMIYATVIKTTDYYIELPKKDGQLNQMHAVFLADIHAGQLTTPNKVKKLAKRINEEAPDIVFLGGDIFDEGTSPGLVAEICDILGGIKTKYGIYYILGNHDLSAASYAELSQCLEQARIIFLDDNIVEIDNSFYLAGRRDSKFERMRLDELLSTASKDLPVILLNHRPEHNEAVDSGKVFLQLSGHTHNGQLFPFIMFNILPDEILYGIEINGNLQTVVTSGAGMYGIPLRLGSSNEIVHLYIEFQ